MDPATAFAMASTAYSGIKAAFEHGRELESMIGDIGRWTSAVFDLRRGARKERERAEKWTMQTVEEEALESFLYKKKVQEQEYEIAQGIKMRFGPTAWDEVIALQGKIRKDRLREIEQKKADQDEMIYYASWAFIIVFMLFMIGSLAYTIIDGIWFS